MTTSSIPAAMLLHGSQDSGESVRSQNVSAVSVLANIMKTSLGPLGLDKMLVDDIGDTTITNDGATILKLLDVEHPAAKVLADLADLQDQEVGDGTTTVVILAAELLNAAEKLISQKIHPTTIINGYRLACKQATQYLQKKLSITVDELGKSAVNNAVITSLSSKLISSEAPFFASMCIDACNAIKFTDSQGNIKMPIDCINVLKAHGKSFNESCLIEGYALNCTVACQGMPKQIQNAKIACLDFSLNKTRMKLGIQIVIEDPDKLKDIQEREIAITREKIQKIIKSGANVVLTTGGIDDVCLKTFVAANVMAVRRCKKADLKRICKATGAQFAYSMCEMDGSEAFPVSNLGQADMVSQERVCDDELILIKGTKARTSASIIIRGPNDYACDEVERSLHDGICVVKRVYESQQLVVGGGATETAISVYLENFATTISTREQLPIAEFATSLLCVPKCLALNAAQDACDMISKLRAYHYTSQINSTKADYKWYSLDLKNNTIFDGRANGILEPLISKLKSLRFATEAAITILRIDDLIRLEKEPKSQMDDECC